MNPGRHKKPRSAPAATPISWHTGWQEVSPPAGEHAPEAGGQPTEAGRQPAEPDGDDQPRLEVEHRVGLSTEPTVLTGDGNREQQYLSVSLEQQVDATAARLLIAHNGTRGVAATANEARRFALDILELVNGQHDPED